MSSKREEERNEKIIRGLMKLPPNRRCVNCNSLGPQYACINFWTFVCVTCSGIHREFTHRVKSVSMSKFTTQEVEALQNGGNQRAKEIFLANWDQRDRLPSSNNIEKIREFIKHVYVDRRYAGGKSAERPPKAMQSQGRSEDEIRRASSYHSYSQSPPYDFQYEDRKNKKQGAVLSRKPGSDRGIYESNTSGLYSPGRFSDHIYAERFAIEQSTSRVSDFSVASDPFGSGPQSPSSQKETGFSSPSFDSSKEKSSDDTKHQATISGVQTQSPQSRGIQQTEAKPDVLQPSVSATSNNVDVFKGQVAKQAVTSSQSIDLFQLDAAPSVDLFQPASASASVSSPTSAFSSMSFFDESFQLSSATNPPANLYESSSSTNDVGWATFDLPQNQPAFDLPRKQRTLGLPQNQASSQNQRTIELHQNQPTFDLHQNPTSLPENQDNAAVMKTSKTGSPLEILNYPHPTTDGYMSWLGLQGSTSHGQPPAVASPWHENQFVPQDPAKESSSQVWKAFEDTAVFPPFETVQSSQISLNEPSANHYINSIETQDSAKVVAQNLVVGVAAPNLPSPFDQPALTSMGGVPTDQKSANPFEFDAPYDNALNSSGDMFFDMSSLGSALPNVPLQSSMVGGIDESWFSPDTTNLCVPTTQGGMPYMIPQPPPSSSLSNVQAHGPVAQIGGNPFA